MEIDGKCHCGAIRYVAQVNPDEVIICHCTDCQTLSGAPYRISVAAPIRELRVIGDPRAYCKCADSGREVTTTFCPDCGTSLWSHGEGRDFVFLRTGSITQRADLPPTKQGFCRSAAPWAMDIRAIPRVPPPPRIDG